MHVSSGENSAKTKNTRDVAPRQRLLDAALRVLTARPVGWPQAEDWLWRQIADDRELVLELFKPFRTSALERIINDAVRNGAPPPKPVPEAQLRGSLEAQRGRAKREAETKARADAAADALREINEQIATMRAKASLFDTWLLSDGSNLLNANARQLRSEAALEMALSAEHRRMGRFYERVADLMPSKATVKDAVPIETLTIIRDQVFAAFPPT